MATKLYHKDVFAHSSVFRSPDPMRVRYTRHAREAAHGDRYGDLTRYLPDWVDVQEGEIVEVEVTDGAITKRVVRQPVTEELDLVMVITTDGSVKTVWGNLHNDQHKTLNRSKFVRNENLH